MRVLVIAAIAAVLTGYALVAHAQAPEPAVVLVGNDAAFTEALRDVLVDERVEAVGTFPAPPLGELSVRSRSVAQARSAIATVWLTPASSGATLVTYDVEKDRLLVRELSYPLPLTATQAAEAARMVKTMLRALRSEDEDAIARAAPPTGVLVTPRAPQFAASVGAGAWFGAPQGTAAPQLMLAAAWRPDDLGAAIVATLAPSSSLDAGMFRGDVGDVVIAAEARKSLPVTPAVRVTAGLGGSLHLVSLDGRLASTTPLVSRRYDPAARIEVIGAVALPHALEVGIAVSADCLLQRQRYEAENESILLVSRIQVMTAAFLGIRL